MSFYVYIEMILNDKDEINKQFVRALESIMFVKI